MNQPLNILLIDDSNIINKIHCKLLKKAKVSKFIKECLSGKDALRFIHDHIDSPTFPDLIFLDLVMPRMSGFSFLEKYINLQSKFEKDTKPVVVVLSDHAEASKLNNARAFSAYGKIEQLQKPLKLENIEDLLSRYF